MKKILLIALFAMHIKATELSFKEQIAQAVKPNKNGKKIVVAIPFEQVFKMPSENACVSLFEEFKNDMIALENTLKTTQEEAEQEEKEEEIANIENNITKRMIELIIKLINLIEPVSQENINLIKGLIKKNIPVFFIVKDIDPQLFITPLMQLLDKYELTDANTLNKEIILKNEQIHGIALNAFLFTDENYIELAIKDLKAELGDTIIVRRIK